MLYVYLRGRIGNQLFIYSFAKQLSVDLEDNDIVIDDSCVVKNGGYKNSLPNYNLPNVRYVHNRIHWLSPKIFRFIPIYCFWRLYRHKKDPNTRYAIEKKKQDFFNRNGGILCENGYMEFSLKKGKNYFIDGYYQSDKYFRGVADEIRKEIGKKDDPIIETYPSIDKIRSRNTVCISIKVQHNVGDSRFGVCDDGYWLRAIEYVLDKVENPLFFICSDNIEYVKNNILDCSKYDVVFQDPSFPVDVSLAVMGMCKHYIIGNTTFGWWAQFLSDNKEKIVVAPHPWMKIDMPIDIYQDGWHLIEV